jgi:hypothetical protein
MYKYNIKGKIPENTENAPKVWIMGIEDGEVEQHKGKANILNKLIQ